VFAASPMIADGLSGAQTIPAPRELDLRRQTQSMTEIARQINPLLRWWIGYYGQYTRSALYPLIRYVNLTLLAWVMRKFKRFSAHKVRAAAS
jgi:hypothetical protein